MPRQTACPVTGPSASPMQPSPGCGRIASGLILVVVGGRPDTELVAASGANLGVKGAIAVDRQMYTSLPDVFAGGYCVVTWHRLLERLTCPSAPASELPWSIDVGAVLDGHDVDPSVLVVDAVDHPVVTPAGAVQPIEPELERLADTVRVGGQ